MGSPAPVRLLLDTHIWLWSLLEPDRLTRLVRQALDDTSNELWLSPISVWETLLLAERGRVTLDPDGPTWVDERLKAGPLREVPLTHAIALESRAVPLGCKDPADRFLAATARVFDLTLVTADRRLARMKGIDVLQNGSR